MVVDGDPMEGALIVFALKAGADPEAISRRNCPRLKEIPFNSRHRFMATLNRVGAVSLVVKGAPRTGSELCAWQRSATGDEHLDAAASQAEIDRLAARGQRGIGLRLEAGA